MSENTPEPVSAVSSSSAAADRTSAQSQQDTFSVMMDAPAASPAPAVQHSGGGGGGGMSFRTMGELQKKEPKLFQAFLMGLASSMIDQMKRQQDHVKAAMRRIRNPQE